MENKNDILFCNDLQKFLLQQQKVTLLNICVSAQQTLEGLNVIEFKMFCSLRSDVSFYHSVIVCMVSVCTVNMML